MENSSVSSFLDFRYWIRAVNFAGAPSEGVEYFEAPKEIMNLAEFQLSQSQSAPPASLSPALQALWFEAKGDWNKAHELAQQADDSSGDWVHAYLHRKEGDGANARYWYARAEKPVCSGSLDEEWAEISEALLTKG